MYNRPFHTTSISNRFETYSGPLRFSLASFQSGSEISNIHTGPYFMALLTVSTEFALTEAGNYVLTASVFHGLAANFGFCACVLHVTRHSTLMASTEIRRLHVKQGIVIVSAEFGGKQSHEIGPRSLREPANA